jgi:hypothetical protein
MNKRGRQAKQVKRLELRREVIRILAGDSLARVHGGWGIGRGDLPACTASESLCNPSRETLDGGP